MTLPALLLIIPLLSAIAILLVTRRLAAISSYISVGAATAMLVCSVLLLVTGNSGETVFFQWIKVGDLSLDIGFTLDKLSRGMMFVVTSIGWLVHVFSLGYMNEDAGKARYFAGLSLFMFSMTGIVLANNFAMMFIFWELVGVSSYLLIGHWFTKNSAAEASKKAFLTNRIGDFGFMAGILILWGLTGSISFSGIGQALPAATAATPLLVTAAALCIFCGAVGKSAQVPLHVWLPDAMEGPTPVSALIHAATMVAAGVYMLFRVTFLIAASATAADIIAWTGGITALMAALMATQQNDIKKILAYSTLSQLGYMVMAIGLLAGEAAMFHLFTHAFFKALLFLGSGAVIYACHHEQDIWKMGGLMKKTPKTFLTFAIGTAALIAVPFTSGFWSKEAILAAAHSENGHPVLFWIAGGVAALTAFYMVRLFVVAFLGKSRSQNAEHAHEVPELMWVPLAILAVPALLAGFAPFADLFSATRPDVHFHLGIEFFVSVAALVIGGGAAFVLYRGKDKDPVNISLLAKKFYLDEIYIGFIRIFQDGIAIVAKVLDDYVVNGVLVRGGSGLANGAGEILRRLQGGSLQTYALFFGIGVIFLIYLAVFGS